MTKLSEVSGQICPGSCCTPRTMMRNATASRHTPSSCGTSLCRLPTRPSATPCTHLNFCTCLCSRASVALFYYYYYLVFSICMLGIECPCYISTLQIRFYSQNGVGWQCQASVHSVHRNGARQNLQQAGSFELFSCC